MFSSRTFTLIEQLKSSGELKDLVINIAFEKCVQLPNELYMNCKRFLLTFSKDFFNLIQDHALTILKSSILYDYQPLREMIESREENTDKNQIIEEWVQSFPH